jgi:Rod binding domain-containing protein
MLDSQLAKEMASRGGIGLSSLLCDQLCTEPEDDE